MEKRTKTDAGNACAAIVLIALAGGAVELCKNGPKGEIYLYGEEHSKQSILDKEFPSGASIEKGM